MASLGDFDGDGITDLAVGAERDDSYVAGGTNRGAVHVLFLNANGTVKSSQKIATTTAADRLSRTATISVVRSLHWETSMVMESPIWPSVPTGTIPVEATVARCTSSS